MATSRAKLIKILEGKYPSIRLADSEDFNGSKGGIWVRSTEDGMTAKDGRNLFDYYAEDNAEIRYVFGVHREIGDILEKHGWYGEWYDAGTMFFYPI